MTTLNKVQDVFLGDTAIFASAWDLVDVNAFLLGKVSNSWSRQGFSTRACISSVITWGCSRYFVLDLVLSDNVSSNWLR